MANKGDIQQIVSDPETQLQGAAKELIEWRKNWDIDALIRFGAKRGLQWSFIMAASQHQNGGAESLIKIAKGIMKSLMKVAGDAKLSLNELNTLLAECANLANERPIGLNPNSQTNPEYLSPNSLLLGRSSSRISAGPFSCRYAYDDSEYAVKSRFQFVQHLTSQFWNTWQKIFFPTLLVRQKWHFERRNIAVGDVCLLQDSSNIRGKWRKCRVVKTFPDSNNIVRNVEVEVAARYDGYSKYAHQKPYTLARHVNKLIVLVPCEEIDVRVNHDSAYDGVSTAILPGPSANDC